MSFLQTRGDAIQNAYSHEQATAYKLLSHRTKIFALQIAEYMNMQTTTHKALLRPILRHVMTISC